MKKFGIINPALSETIASLGHTDGLMVCDAGLPIPDGPKRIDLTVIRGVPSFEQVLSAVVPEIEIERAVMAKEAIGENPGVVELVRRLLPDVEVEFVAHEELKALSRASKAIVRTAEFSPFANVILYSGVSHLFSGE